MTSRVQSPSGHHPMFGTDPGPLNPHARPGFGKELSKRYTAWSNAHPDHSQAEGADMHRHIANAITPMFPTYGELQQSPPTCPHCGDEGCDQCYTDEDIKSAIGDEKYHAIKNGD